MTRKRWSAHFGQPYAWTAVRLFRCGRGKHVCKRRAFADILAGCMDFRTFDFRLARFADQLLDRWHSGFIPV